jgi:hypothetical protein
MLSRSGGARPLEEKRSGMAEEQRACWKAAPADSGQYRKRTARAICRAHAGESPRERGQVEP